MQSIQDAISKLELPTINEDLKNNFLNYLQAAKKIYQGNAKFNADFNDHTLAMIFYKMVQFSYSRDCRLDDIRSEEVRSAIAIKQELFQLGIPFIVVCLDGRLMTKIMFGLYGHSYRTPAADIKTEFLAKSDNSEEVFLVNGHFSKLIDQNFIDNKAEVMTEI